MIGVSLKMYFGYQQTLDWATAIEKIASEHPAVKAGVAEVFILPSFPALESTASICADSAISFGAQNLAEADAGAYTGEVSGPFLAEVGCRYVEVGHAERRALFGETDQVVRAKTAAAFRAGLTPVLCIGELERTDPDSAAALCIRDIEDALSDADFSNRGPAPLLVAYEPQWAIGAPAPAEPAYIADVCQKIRGYLESRTEFVGRVIYGGSAGVGLITALGTTVDGLFLGRFAHDPEAVRKILDEVGELSV
ncbi:triose-phosphate isomerase [Saxibacter everestensis]|uniref:Triosephosphate isomerase n=1 Tax=Saxibacter everestensis TaxID=2909229 RepID=A0ABY8QYM6_9MICO|nr:triose-phosphate isomerase [Brevibacteriaceae bacterium ZFBP1038]